MRSSDRQRSRSRSRYGFHDLEKVLHKRLIERGGFFEPQFPGNGFSVHFILRFKLHYLI